jgi:hypothetical protein
MIEKRANDERLITRDKGKRDSVGQIDLRGK